MASLGCFNEIPPTVWLIGNRNSFLTVLEAGGPRSGRLRGRVLGRAPSWWHTWPPSCPPVQERWRAGFLFYCKGINPTDGGATLMC